MPKRGNPIIVSVTGVTDQGCMIPGAFIGQPDRNLVSTPGKSEKGDLILKKKKSEFNSWVSHFKYHFVFFNSISVGFVGYLKAWYHLHVWRITPSYFGVPEFDPYHDMPALHQTTMVVAFQAAFPDGV